MIYWSQYINGISKSSTTNCEKKRRNPGSLTRAHQDIRKSILGGTWNGFHASVERGMWIPRSVEASVESRVESSVELSVESSAETRIVRDVWNRAQKNKKLTNEHKLRQSRLHFSHPKGSAQTKCENSRRPASQSQSAAARNPTSQKN